MKKIITSFILCMTLFMLSSISTFAATVYVKVTASDGTVSWTKITGTIKGTNFTIGNGYQRAISSDVEETIDLNEVWSNEDGTGNHYVVVRIEYGAFLKCTKLKKVIFPESSINIYYHAFEGCFNLTSISIQKGEIRSNAFLNCKKLKEVILGNGVTTIESSAFKGCISLTEIDIPDGIKSISSYTFSGCTSLSKVTIPNSVTKIDQQAFGYCI